MSQYFTPATLGIEGAWQYNVAIYQGNMYIPIVATGQTQIKVVDMINPSIVSYIDLPSTAVALTISEKRNTLYYLTGAGIKKILLSDSNYTSYTLSNVSGYNLPSAIYIDDLTDTIYVADSGNNRVLTVSAETEWGLNTSSQLQGIGRGLSFTPYDGYIYYLGGGRISRITPNADPSLVTYQEVANLDYITAGGVQLAMWGIFIQEPYIYITCIRYIPPAPEKSYPDGAFIRFNFNKAAIPITSQVDYTSKTIFGLAPSYYPNVSGALVHTAKYMYLSSSEYIFKVSMPITDKIGNPPIPFDYSCFKSDTKILTDSGYRYIQDLRPGDLIKTRASGYKPVCMIGTIEIEHPASPDRIKNQLYTYSNDKCSEIFEDLVVTGCHSVLVDEFVSPEQRATTAEVLGNIYVTENKYRLPACVDDRSAIYDKPGTYAIYHLALEHDNYYMNYGVYANGLLVETCSKRYLKELSHMTLIE